MPQKHDIGYKKRLGRKKPKVRPAVLDHARDLVRRGLASRAILNGLDVNPYRTKEHQ